jgi:hypothetical protein
MQKLFTGNYAKIYSIAINFIFLQTMAMSNLKKTFYFIFEIAFEKTPLLKFY